MGEALITRRGGSGSGQGNNQERIGKAYCEVEESPTMSGYIAVGKSLEWTLYCKSDQSNYLTPSKGTPIEDVFVTSVQNDGSRLNCMMIHARFGEVVEEIHTSGDGLISVKTVTEYIPALEADKIHQVKVTITVLATNGASLKFSQSIPKVRYYRYMPV